MLSILVRITYCNIQKLCIVSHVFCMIPRVGGIYCLHFNVKKYILLLFLPELRYGYTKVFSLLSFICFKMGEIHMTRIVHKWYFLFNHQRLLTYLNEWYTLGHDVLTAGKLARKFGHYSFSTTRKVLCFGKWYAFLVLLIFIFMFPHTKICFFHKEGEFILPEGRFIKIS